MEASDPTVSTAGASIPEGPAKRSATAIAGAIELRGLRLLGVHGMLREELHRPQPFEVDVDVCGDLSEAATSDELADTVDYGAVLGLVAEVVGGPPHRLLESLASEIADRILISSPPYIDRVTVSVRKLRPPVAYDLAFAGVRVTRSRTRP